MLLTVSLKVTDYDLITVLVLGGTVVWEYYFQRFAHGYVYSVNTHTRAGNFTLHSPVALVKGEVCNFYS